MAAPKCPGRPFQFGTTPEFLAHFGVNSLKDLPKLEWAPEPEPEKEEAPLAPIRSKEMEQLAEDLVTPSTGLKKLLEKIRRKG